ncbi:septum formation initiator [Streptomyces sp. DSM 44915]|uniref:Septum formation initiator n=1 Tax=Streptomyces chisholmiae TaxID=3075540 RepID=A0ABU2JJ03_9ACTN|nr:septum formation initiator [Streptomyces sp. DSM 44915]MDT0264972.1 septum formation initiator [Streptomyces sp. DSM 44915]
MSRRDRFATRAGLTRLVGLGQPRGANAARAPFVLLVVVLLGAGMVTLLILNASLNQGSFMLSELRRETQELTDEQQRLQAEVDGYSAPGALAERATELGLVPAGPPAFLGADGELLGGVTPSPAPEPVEPTEPDEGVVEPAPELPTEVVPQGAAAEDAEDAPEEPAEAEAEPEPEAGAEPDQEPAAGAEPTPDDAAPAPVAPPAAEPAPPAGPPAGPPLPPAEGANP